jgi:hypothetical protein
MVDTITPVVHGGKRSRWLTSVLLHALGATVAAAAFGAVLGGLGALLAEVASPELRLGLIAAIALVYFAREAFKLPVPIPDRHRQVPEWWRTFYSPPVAALLYGFGLGIGFFTYLLFGTFVAVSAAALLIGDPLIGIALCAPFGLARGLSVVIAARRDDPVDDLSEIGATSAPRLVNAAALASIATTAVIVLTGQGWESRF